MTSKPFNNYESLSTDTTPETATELNPSVISISRRLNEEGSPVYAANLKESPSSPNEPFVIDFDIPEF